MKKLSACIFLFIISFCFILTGCSGANIGMPENYLQVTSNGGFVVSVGNTLYFSNAYKSYSNLTEASDNDGDKVAQHSLKRVGVNSNDQKTLVENEEGKVEYANLVNKIAGYETSNIFVVGEYLYFTSPNIHKNDSKEAEDYNTYEFELSSLFKIKLDGSGLKEIYTTETSNAKFYLVGGEQKSILVFDDSKIMQLKCYENANSLTTLAEKVTSTIFPNNQGEELTNVYYTIAREEDDNFTGNIVKVLNVSTGEISDVSGYSKNGETITLISYDNNRLFYLRKGLPNQDDALYSNDFSNGYASEIRHKYTIDGFENGSDLLVVSNQEYDVNVFVFEYNNNIFMQDLSSTVDTTAVKLTTETSEIAFVSGTYVYYTTEAGIFRVSVLTKNTQQVSDKVANADAVDFDGRYVYFYASVDGSTSGSYYLHRADVEAANNNLVNVECISELLEEDIVEEE
ncbi:MAG: hypothetical protein E7376_04335 [Clostridiales bacterium]|nr:hypothetical protein [Clostridiales bacterium]